MFHKPNQVLGTGSTGLGNMVLALRKLVIRRERRVVRWMLRESLRSGALSYPEKLPNRFMSLPAVDCARLQLDYFAFLF